MAITITGGTPKKKISCDCDLVVIQGEFTIIDINDTVQQTVDKYNSLINQ